MQVRRRWVGLGALVAVVAVTALVTASLVGADSSTGAILNTAPVTKIVYTGGTAPGSNYSVIDRLTLPVGSWAIFAKTTLFATGVTTGVECYLTAPNAVADYAGAGIGVGSKESSVRNLAFTTVTNVPNGGNVDLRCRLTNSAADRTVFAHGTTITAVSVSGTTAMRTVPPSLGS